jgi:hypothetical protein
MIRIAHLIHRLATWLNAVDAPTESTLSPRDWSDLPAYHPASDRDR